MVNYSVYTFTINVMNKNATIIKQTKQGKYSNTQGQISHLDYHQNLLLLMDQRLNHLISSATIVAMLRRWTARHCGA